MRLTKEQRQVEYEVAKKFLDTIAPKSGPLAILYQITPSGWLNVFESAFEDFTEALDDALLSFGPGSYILRTRFSDGTMGPSRKLTVTADTITAIKEKGKQ